MAEEVQPATPIILRGETSPTAQTDISGEGAGEQNIPVQPNLPLGGGGQNNSFP